MGRQGQELAVGRRLARLLYRGHTHASLARELGVSPEWVRAMVRQWLAEPVPPVRRSRVVARGRGDTPGRVLVRALGEVVKVR
jgi:hypothetical protein